MEDELITRAKTLVLEYLKDKRPDLEQPTLFVVWQASILENFKCLIATPQWMYYELTYDGEKRRWYLDVFRKVGNVVIPDD